MQHELRACWFCHTPIHACFGFSLGRDYLSADAAQKAGKEIPRVRELCGRCVEKAAILIFGDDLMEERPRDARGLLDPVRAAALDRQHRRLKRAAMSVRQNVLP